MTRLIELGFFSFVALFSVSPLSAQGKGYTNNEIIAVTKELGNAIQMPDAKADDLVHNFKKVAEQDGFKDTIKNRPIAAVFVYKSTEAGLIYKRMGGKGVVAFTKNKKKSNIKISSSSLGAQIGGSAEWGLGLVIGLKDPSHFGGSYSGKIKSATAVDTTASWGELFSNSDYTASDKAHDICLIVSGRGLSAGVGKGKITISLED